MIDLIIKDINCALDNKAYFAALCLALTLPDICGKAKYPKEKTTYRYKQWLNDYVCNKQPFGLQADAGTIYNLRCSLLHDGNPSIDKQKCKIKKFALIVRENSAHIPLESSSFEEKPDGSKVCECYNININFLCEKICEAALTYYQSNSEFFNFFNYRIINTDDETAKTFGLSDEMAE